MGQTHRDDDCFQSESLRALFDEKQRAAQVDLADLVQRANKMTDAGENQLTAGKPGEAALAEGRHGRFTVTRMPDDPPCLRISIGHAPNIDDSGYVVFRGDPRLCRELLRDALEALQRAVLTYR